VIKYRLIIFVNEYVAMIIVAVNEEAVVTLINHELGISHSKLVFRRNLFGYL